MKPRTSGAVLAVVFLLLASSLPGQHRALHVLGGASSALLACALADPLLPNRSGREDAWILASIGVGAALVAGSVKECLDLAGWGEPDLVDLVLTVGGGVLAATSVYLLTTGRSASASGSGSLSAVYAAFGIVLSLPVGENLLKRAIPSSRSRS